MSELSDLAEEADDADDAAWFKDNASRIVEALGEAANLERAYRLQSSDLITRTEQLTHMDTLLVFEKSETKKLKEDRDALVAKIDRAKGHLKRNMSLYALRELQQ